tara:strand:- start:606 stop:1562 length:957 start_codon:yes stop_codon:yes gene_type:complete
MKKVLIIEKIHQSGIDQLKKRKDFSYEVVENLEKNFLKNKLKDCDAVSLKVSKLDKELIESAKKLKIISRHGVGYDNVDIESAKKNKITLAITANANATSVAEHVFFMMLSISRGVAMYDKCVREGNFSKRNHLQLTKELYNKNILIAGFGRVGKNLIKKCNGFDMNVFVYDPYIEHKTIISFGGKKVNDLSKAIKDMDYVSLHLPAKNETKNLINLKILNSMKKTSIIINTSRGSIINETDLNEALNKNMISGAGIDVFEKEPPEKNNPLLKNKKVFLSPHSSTFTEECTKRMGEETIKNIIDFFDGKLDKSMIVKL